MFDQTAYENEKAAMMEEKVNGMFAMMDHFLHWQCQADFETAKKYFHEFEKRVGSYNEFTGTLGLLLLEEIMEVLPAMRFNSGIELVIGREYSPVIYVKVNVGYLQTRLTDSHLTIWQSAMAGISHRVKADEFSMEVDIEPENSFKSKFCGYVTFRFWWD